MKCQRCDTGEHLAFRWQHFGNGTKHIRVDCTQCGQYVKFAPQTEENLARVGDANNDVSRNALR